VKQGDLVLYREPDSAIPSRSSWGINENECWLVLFVSKQKKVWHRNIFLYNGRYVIHVPWVEREIFEVISEAD
jgi:hypothetical protein